MGETEDATRGLTEGAAIRQAHLERMSNTTGAAGEQHVIETIDNLIPRPKGLGLRILLDQLRDAGVTIAGTSFDAILLPDGEPVDFTDPAEVERYLDEMVFVEIKSTKKDSVKDDFSGFFFSLTEKEIDAARQLGNRHVVLLHNRLTGAIRQTTVGEIAAASRSTTWQVSVLL